MGPELGIGCDSGSRADYTLLVAAACQAVAILASVILLCVGTGS